MFNKNEQQNILPQSQPFRQQSTTINKFSVDNLIGYILLFFGLFMIFLAVFLTYNALTGKYKPPKVSNYHLPALEISAPASSIQLPAGVELPEGFQLPTNSTPSKFQIPDEIVNDAVSIGFYYLLMVFVASAGSKVAGIGVRMIKDIKIKI